MLERIYNYDELMKKPYLAFVLGLFYSLLAMVIAINVFPEDPALVTVAFISIMFLPTLYYLFKEGEKRERKELYFDAKRLFEDNKNILKVYLSFSLGVFIVFAIFSILLPELATNHLFEEQVSILSKNIAQAQNISGGAVSYSFVNFMQVFASILRNNAIVLFVCFVISLIAGNGAIFFITWNVSVWATVFGNISKLAGTATNMNPFGFFFVTLVAVLPHAALEITSYILAGISGGVISRSILSEKLNSNKFKSVIVYNIMLLLISLLVLVIGALVETIVLQNATFYRGVIMLAFGV